MIQSMRSLVIFRKILENPVIHLALNLCDAAKLCDGGSAVQDDFDGAVYACAEFEAALFGHTENWSRYLLSCTLQDENFYLQKMLSGEAVSDVISARLLAELEILRRFSVLSYSDFAFPSDTALPQWQTETLDFAGIYTSHIVDIPRLGYGIYAKHNTFRLIDGNLEPVMHPDDISLFDLVGYSRQREMVLENTKALIKGAPAANVLLYGDSGTGKSSTVKVVLNELASYGLRLIELAKEELHHIPALLDQLGGSPLKFILFIDDLSFTKDDDNFRALKAVLEGSVAARRQNVVVYATSNRRHLVRESFSDRDGDEVHVGDTLEEQSSLSDRFGLFITFSRPDKEEYLEIVAYLAQKSGIVMPADELSIKAQAFALRRGGRSPRVAHQFVEQLVTMQIIGD